MVPTVVLISEGVNVKRSASTSTVCVAWAAGCGSCEYHGHDDGERDNRDEQQGFTHQNHHPRPMLKELGAAMTELRLRAIT